MRDRFVGQTASELKNNEVALISILREAGAKVKGRAICCPFCDDRHPSGGIYQPNGDGFRYKCHKCSFNGSIIDVLAKVDGITTDEVFRQLRGKPQPKANIYPNIDSLKQAMSHPVEAVYQYTDPNTGQPDLLVLRLKTPDGKTFRQCRPVSGGYIQQAPAKPWPLYNRTRVRDADVVVVVEGEKCVHALHKVGIVATTNPAGAGKAEYANWTPLTGKSVVLWPDNDDTGKAHMKQVESILQTLDTRISIIEPADFDLGPKEDVFDFLQKGGDIYDALKQAQPRGIASGLGELIESTIRGEREAIKWPWFSVSGLTKSLLPGSVTIVCGGVGASKSFMLLEAGAYWHKNDVKVAIYELEESREFHLSRCLAQLSSTSELTDPDWIKLHPEQARKLFAEHETFIESFGSCVYASPDTQPTLEQLAKWVQDRAKAGCRIIAIDPVTAGAHERKSTWEEDNAFLHNIKRAAVDYHCSVVLITHPVKAASFPDMTQLAGGAAYSRFAQTILWLESHAEKSSQVKMSCGTTEATHNRTLHLLKARNGRGQGVRLACNFETDSLTLSEIGIILRGKNK